MVTSVEKGNNVESGVVQTPVPEIEAPGKNSLLFNLLY